MSEAILFLACELQMLLDQIRLIFSRGEVRFPANKHKRTAHQAKNPSPSSWISA